MSSFLFFFFSLHSFPSIHFSIIDSIPKMKFFGSRLITLKIYKLYRIRAKGRSREIGMLKEEINSRWARKDTEPTRGMRARLRRPRALLGGNRFRLNGVRPPLSFPFLLLSPRSRTPWIRSLASRKLFVPTVHTYVLLFELKKKNLKKH